MVWHVCLAMMIIDSTAQTAFLLLHPDERQSARLNLVKLMAKSKSNRAVERRYVCKDGTVLWVLVSIAHIPRPADLRRAEFMLLRSRQPTNRRRPSGRQPMRWRTGTLPSTVRAKAYGILISKTPLGISRRPGGACAAFLKTNMYQAILRNGCPLFIR